MSSLELSDIHRPQNSIKDRLQALYQTNTTLKVILPFNLEKCLLCLLNIIILKARRCFSIKKMQVYVDRLCYFHLDLQSSN